MGGKQIAQTRFTIEENESPGRIGDELSFSPEESRTSFPFPVNQTESLFTRESPLSRAGVPRPETDGETNEHFH